MEAVECSRPWPNHVTLSVEDTLPSGWQSPQQSRSRLSPPRRRGKHRASSFDEVLVDELDMLQDAAATIIQAAWRGYRVREQLQAEHEAAIAIQALWRGHLARQRAATQQAEAAAWDDYEAKPGYQRAEVGHRWTEPGYHEAQPGHHWDEPRHQEAKPGHQWAEPGYRRAEPRHHWAEPGYRRAQPGYCRAEPRHRWAKPGPRWAEPSLAEEQAAVVIQAHYRGYRVRCEIHNQHVAAAIIQAHYRGYQVRQDLAAMHQAATTIQAHWRGHCARQAVAQARAVPPSSSSLRDFLSQTYHGLLDYVTGAQPAPSRTRLPPKKPPSTQAPSQLSVPAGRPGQPSAGGEQLLTAASRAQRGGPGLATCKTCPQCGRNTMVRVLVGVGRGTDAQAGAGLERDYRVPGLSRPTDPRTEGASLTHPPTSAGHGRAQAHRAGLYTAERAEGAAHRTWATSQMAAEAQAAPTVPHWGRKPGLWDGPFAVQPAIPCGAWGGGTVAAHSAMLYPSASSCPPSTTGGTRPAWITHHTWGGQPHGEGHIFKTRKQHWQLAHAATLIQAFWRGCQARRALREQQEAAVRIQATFRGYRTRAYLSAAGVLSGAEMEEAADAGWSCRPGRCR